MCELAACWVGTSLLCRLTVVQQSSNLTAVQNGRCSAKFKPHCCPDWPLLSKVQTSLLSRLAVQQSSNLTAVQTDRCSAKFKPHCCADWPLFSKVQTSLLCRLAVVQQSSNLTAVQTDRCSAKFKPHCCADWPLLSKVRCPATNAKPALRPTSLSLRPRLMV